MDEPGPSSAYYARFASTANGPVRPPSRPASPLLSSGADSYLDSAQAESLYAVLNVPTTASPAEIRDRYRALAAALHPDKQRNDAHRDMAHRQFQEIQRAYEVLTDPQRRTVYDMFGEQGLRTSWEVGPRVMTPDEKQASAKRQLEIEALVKSKGDMSLVLDARAVFLPRTFFRNPASLSHSPLARLQRARPGQIVLRHSFETPLTDSTQAIWEATAATRSGAGGANVSGTIKHQFSPRFWAQTSQTLLGPRINTAKGTFTFDENTYVTGTVITQTLAAPPRVSVTLGRRLFPQTTGFITFKSGVWALGPWGATLPAEAFLSDQSALTVGVTTARRDGSGWTLETSTGRVDNAVSADWSTQLAGLSLRLGGSLDLAAGVTAFADATGKVTEHVRVGMMLQAQLRGGVQLRFKLMRLGQKITVPVLLSQDLNPYVVLASAVIPATSYAALYHFYLLPKKRRRIDDRIQQLREEHRDYIEQKRAEAAEATSLMERSVTAKAAAEREKHGLVIVSAHYGRADAFTERGLKDDAAVIDVTVPVQALVQASRLYIPGGRNKCSLLGFYDPCVGENKKLRVRYLFRDVEHEITVDDVSALRAPVKGHALS